MGQVGALCAGTGRAVLSARPGEGQAGDDGLCVPLAKGPILAAVLRRSLPRLIEATFIPNLLFFLALTLANAGTAMVAVAVWSYGAVVRRLVKREAIPGVLLLAVMGLTARTVVSVASDSPHFYFLQPVATTVIGAGVFLGSLVVGRPLIGRLAGDFCPIAPEVAVRPAVLRLYRRLTVVWAGVYLATAATTAAMLFSMPLGTFVAAKTVACMAITMGGVFVTVAWSVRTARGEGLVFAPPADEPATLDLPAGVAVAA